MTETQSKKQDAREAITYMDGKPCLELGATRFTYLITTADDRHKLFVTLKPYEPYSVKKFYDQAMPKRKARSTTERAVIPSDSTEIRQFILDHFLSFGGATLEDGSEPTPAQQRNWLEENGAFVERVFRRGVDALKPVEKPEASGKAILVFGQKEHRIEYEVRLYSVERKMEETVTLTAVLERFSQPDKHKYEKAVAYIENSRSGESFVEANWDVIEQLCDHKIVRLEGAVLDGKPCEAENRKHWLKPMPLIHKLWIVGQVMQDIDIKNG